jgi:hypothetical protein
MATTTPPGSLDTTFPVETKCEICSITDNLQCCAGCRVVYYCNKDHQTSHWKEHKHVCKQIRSAQRKLEKEEAKLRALPEDSWPSCRVFEDDAGKFWKILETRPYMKARQAFCELVLWANNATCRKVALNHWLDMLRLCRGDNLGVRERIPGLYLRLGRIQESYDFIKWWAVHDPDGKYDSADNTLPYLSLKNENVFESPNVLGDISRMSLFHLESLLLLKIKLYKELEILNNVKPVGGDMPQKIMDEIGRELVDEVVAKNQKAIKDPAVVRDETELQIIRICEMVERHNKFALSALMNPEVHLGEESHAYSVGSIEEVRLMIMYDIRGWTEDEDCIKLLYEFVLQKMKK